MFVVGVTCVVTCAVTVGGVVILNFLFPTNGNPFRGLLPPGMNLPHGITVGNGFNFGPPGVMGPQ